MEGLGQEMDRIGGQIDRLFPEYGINLQEMFGKIMGGEFGDAFQMILKGLADAVRSESASIKSIFFLLLCVGILGAVLTQAAGMFENRQISDIAFYFIYLFLMLALMKVFETVMFTASGLLENLLLFMQLFMPLYFLAVGAAAGVSTSLMYYQLILLLIYGVETVLTCVVMPLIRAYVFLAFLNGLWAEEKLHMLLDFLKKIIGYLLKLSFAAVTGISLVQSLITPVIDSLRMSALQKTVSLIPGIGNVSGSVAEMVLGSAVLIKNSVGVVAVFLLLLLCAVPVFKIWFLAMALKAGAAVSGIVADRRLISCMDKVGEGSLLVLRAMITACGLFFLTIAIAAITTNRGF